MVDGCSGRDQPPAPRPPEASILGSGSKYGPGVTCNYFPVNLLELGSFWLFLRELLIWPWFGDCLAPWMEVRWVGLA